MALDSSALSPKHLASFPALFTPGPEVEAIYDIPMVTWLSKPSLIVVLGGNTACLAHENLVMKVLVMRRWGHLLLGAGVD